MKKITNIGLILGLMIMIKTAGNAQHVYTSYGYAHDWYIPEFVNYTIYDHYYGYEIAHVQRFTRHGHTNFNVLLHRNGWFVELRFNQYGHVYKTIRHRWNYPLVSHHCTGHCGYHSTYYLTYYPKYHKHYKHKHHNRDYVIKDHGHKHHKGKSYYTNVYVETQPKHNNQHGNYNNHVNHRNQQQRTRGEIRKPPQNNRQTQQVVRSRNSTQLQRIASEVRKPQQSRSASSRSNYKSNSIKSSNGERAKRLMAYKSGRSDR